VVYWTLLNTFSWSGTKVVFLPKPGRNGYILAKDFRLISLSPLSKKTLKILGDRFLENGFLLSKSFASSQYAYI